MRPVDVKRKEEGGDVLDEAFLQRVDRVLLMRKQCDPYRLEEVQRATQQEIQLANLTNECGMEQLSGRLHGRPR